MPTLNVKKICPAASSQTRADKSVEKSGFQTKPRPLLTFQSGWAGSGVPKVRTRIKRMIAQKKSAGSAHLQKRSMPPLMPW